MDRNIPSTVRMDKPWGKFEQYTHNLPSTVKVITVIPGGTLSLQYHDKRDELWVALDPGAQVEVGTQNVRLQPGDTIFITRGTPHRLSAPSETTVRILEISFGEFDEEDIVRLEDVYGRVNSRHPT